MAVVRSGVRCSRSCPSARDLWTVAFAGGKPRLALGGAWSGDWSPSGHALAALRSDGIWIVAVGSGKVRQLSSVSGEPGAPADWSPDGSRLLLVSSTGLVTVSALDGSVTTLRAPPAPPASGDPKGCLHLARPLWSPDGRWIAYEDWGCFEDGVPFSRIEIIDAEGNYRWTVSNDQYPWVYEAGQSLAVWSPDSLSLAFLDDRLNSEGDSFLATSRLLATATRSDFRFDYRQLRGGVFSAPAWQPLPRPRS